MTGGNPRPAERVIAMALSDEDRASAWLPGLMASLAEAGYRGAIINLSADHVIDEIESMAPRAILLHVVDGPSAESARRLGPLRIPLLFLEDGSREAAHPPRSDVVAVGASGAQLQSQIETAIERATSAALSLTPADLYRAAFEASPVAMTLTGGPGTYMNYNPAFVELLGYSRDDLAHLTIEAISHPEDYREDARFFMELLTGQRDSYELEKRYRHKDGGEVWGRLTVSRLDGAGSSAPAFLVVLQDVRRQKETESALRDAEVLLQQLMDSMTVVFWALTPDWKQVEYINPAWEEVYGLPCDQLRANPGLWIDMMHPDDREGALAHYERNRGRSSTYEYRIIDASGRIHWIRDTAFPVLDSRGEIKLVAGFGEDITERKLDEEHRQQVEAQLLRTQKLQSLGLLAGGVAHDFNNLLTVILANAGIMGGRPLDSTASKALEEIERASMRAADLCRQMLAFAGRSPVDTQAVHLSDLVADMSSMLHVTTSRSTTLHTDLSPSLPTIKGDATQLRQVIMNLILNAAEAIGGNPGKISITTSVAKVDRRTLRDCFIGDDSIDEPHVLLEVRDTGCGMDEKTVQLVFDPFFTTKLTGRGLGLAAVLGVVRSHRGALAIESAPGQGTTFRLYFPVAPQERAHADARAESVHPLSASGTILVVDDQEPVLRATGGLLRSLGFDVLLASSGEQAMEIVRRRKDGLVCALLDLTMPGMDGLQTLAALRDIDPDIRVILASGYSSQRLERAAVEANAAGVLHKPYDLDMLTRELRRILA